MEFFKDKYEAEKITSGSEKMVNTKCPVCGLEKKYRMATLSKRGYRCPTCYGGYSFPNRCMSAILSTLGVEFCPEKCFPWSERLRYDFYLPNQSAIIEMHGEQHYNDKTGWSSLEGVQSRDEEKKRLAEKNGILHYIVIPADVSTIEYISQNIYKSKLPDILGLSENSIDWATVGTLSLKGVPSRCADLWRSGVKDINQIAKVVGVSSESVSAHLKKFASLGLCDYSIKEQRMIGSRAAWIARRTEVLCENTGEIFESIRAAANRYGIAERALQNCLKGRCASSGHDESGNKLKWKYYKRSDDLSVSEVDHL